MFWENFCKLCRDKGVTRKQAVADIGVAGGILTRWREGALPRGETLAKVADYFGVTVDQLLFGEQGNPLLPLPLVLSDGEEEVVRAMRRQPEMVVPVRRLLGLE